MNAVSAPNCPASKAWATFQARAAMTGHSAIKSGGVWIAVAVDVKVVVACVW